jgi:hypothetical protein
MEPATDLAVELEDWLAADIGEIPEATDLPIEDDVFADRVLRRLAIAKRDSDKAVADCAEQVARMENWRDRRLARLDGEQRYCTQALEAFMRNRHERGGPKTLELPNGTLRLRAPRPSVDVRDPDGFVAWALGAHDELLSFPPPPEPRPDKRALAQLEHAKASRPFGGQLEHDLVLDGEIIPGVHFVVAPVDSFSVELESRP